MNATLPEKSEWSLSDSGREEAINWVRWRSRFCRESCEDIVQDAAIEAHERGCRSTTFFYNLLGLRVIDVARAKASRERRERIVAKRERYDDDFTQIEVEDLLDKVQPDRREVLELVMSGYSWCEIADKLGQNMPGVKSKKRRGADQARELFMGAL